MVEMSRRRGETDFAGHRRRVASHEHV